MSYYRGDYYRGDYYRGDPFLGALVGAVGGKLLGKAGAALGGLARRVIGSPTARTAAAGAATAATTVAIDRALGGGMPTISPLPSLPGLGPETSRSTTGAGEWGGRKKYRKMNPLNPKALRRALRRAEGFEKFARKTVSGLRYGPKKFKTQKRSK